MVVRLWMMCELARVVVFLMRCGGCGCADGWMDVGLSGLSEFSDAEYVCNSKDVPEIGRH